MALPHARRGVFLLAFLILLSHTLASAASKFRMGLWNVPEVRDVNFVPDRVAILTAERKNAATDHWCMGLLVAPDALLTHAHCVADKTIQWAFFGNLREDVVDVQMKQSVGNLAPVHAAAAAVETGSEATDWVNATSLLTSSNSSNDRSSSSSSQATESSLSRERGVEVGDVVHWVQVIDVIIHPEYDPASNATKDLAIVRLQVARDIEPFQLLPDAETNGTGVLMRNQFAGYRVSNAFMGNADAPKIRSIGSFYRTPWVYCTYSHVNGKKLSKKLKQKDRMCVVPSVVDMRVELSTINSFVMVGDQLAGLSMCYSNDCKKSVVHPYMLVSGAQEFIKDATQKQGKWTDMGLLMIGGESTPLQGYLSGLRKTKAAQNFCLGSLIAPQVVLTAAHCVKDVSFSYVSVGSRYSASETDGEQIKIKNVKIHPSFNAKTYEYDFALVELMYMSIQTPLVLDNESDQDLYSTSTLTLYGYNEAQQTQTLALPLVSASTCKSMIADASVDTSAMVCAGGEEGKDGCQGDSGAPLVQDSNGDSSYLVALSSFGWGCGVKGVPAVYAKVTAATSFIQQNVLGHSWRYRLGSNGLVPSGESDDDEVGSDSDKQQEQPNPGTSHPLWPPEKDRSNDGAASGVGAASEDEIISRICEKEKWTLTERILLTGGIQSIMIPTTTSQFTRDTVATTLLASAGAEVYELDDDSDVAAATASRYSCAGSIELFSSADLSSIRATLAKFENRKLRSRKSRFARQPGTTRLPPSP